MKSLYKKISVLLIIILNYNGSYSIEHVSSVLSENSLKENIESIEKDSQKMLESMTMSNDTREKIKNVLNNPNVPQEDKDEMIEALKKMKECKNASNSIINGNNY